MKKIAIYAVAAMLAISGAANVAAATDNIGPKLTYNENNTDSSVHGQVIVKGNLDGVSEGSLVSLTVYEKSKGVAEGLKWYEQVKAGKDGAYEFTCTLEGVGEGTEYILAVAAEGHNGESELFTYYSKEKARSIIAGLTSADAIEKAITEYDTFLQIDTTVYDTLSNDGKEKAQKNAATELQKLKVELANKGKALSAADFANVLKDCSKVEVINETTDVDEYEVKLVELVAEEVPAVAEIFDELKDNAAVVAEMKDTKYESKSALINDFNDKVLSTAANDAEVTAEMMKVITDTADETGIDLRLYNSLSVAEQTEIMSEMLKKDNYTNCADIKGNFERVMALHAMNSDTSSGSGSNFGVGGGSSGTGEGSGSLAPAPQPVVTQGPFADLGSVNWAVDSIRKLYVKGVVSGDENGNFNPNNNVTRAEFVKMLVSAMDMLGKGTGLSFDDVGGDAWYHDYVIAAAENELVSGMTETSFGPNLPITRQDAAVIIFRAAGIKNVNMDAIKEAKIADQAEIADYAEEAVKSLYATGLLNGVGEDKFAPKNNMTRAQAAVIMSSFLERMEATK